MPNAATCSQEIYLFSNVIINKFPLQHLATPLPVIDLVRVYIFGRLWRKNLIPLRSSHTEFFA